MNGFAQSSNDSILKVEKIDYLEKSRKQMKTANILAITSIVLITTNVATLGNISSGGDYQFLQYLAFSWIVTGTTAIIFAYKSNQNKKKALALEYGMYFPSLYKDKTVAAFSNPIPILSVKIRF